MSDYKFLVSTTEAAILRMMARGYSMKAAAVKRGVNVNTCIEQMRQARLRNECANVYQLLAEFIVKQEGDRFKEEIKRLKYLARDTGQRRT